MADEKELMLGRIRRALGREDAPSPPLPLNPFVHASVAENQAARLGRFRAELEAAGGRLEVADPASGLRGRLEELLDSLKPSTVAVSDRVETRVRGLSEWLQGRGVRVVHSPQPSLSEHAGGEDARRASASEAYKHSLLEADVGVTCADFAVADTGSVVIVSGGERHRLISLLPPVHVCLLEPGAILSGLPELYTLLKPDPLTGLFPHAVTLITGPSKTGDIEQTLTVGVHGPRELCVLLDAPGLG